MSKKKFLEAIRVKDPCTQEWNEMVGNDQFRFCTHCAKDVSDISTMTRSEALKFVRKSNGRICIRYRQDPQTKAPLFAEQLVQISRRTAKLAAGVMSASLSLSALAYSQAPNVAMSPLTDPSYTIRDIEKKKDDETGAKGAHVFGRVSDPAGAVIPGATVTLSNQDSGGSYLISTDENGEYSIDNAGPGVYTLEITSSGFAPSVFADIKIGSGSALKYDVSMEPIGMVISGGMIAMPVVYAQPLVKAVHQNDLELVDELIARGEDVNEAEENKTTPLMIAVENGYYKVAETLLNFGAKVNAKDEDKRSILMWLDEDATKELAELLLRHGAKVNAKDANGNTALIFSAGSVSPEVLQALIDAGADVNAVNSDGVSPLMSAAQNDNLENVRILINAGADVNAKDNEGETAWDKTGEDAIEELLVSFGATPGETAEPAAEEPPADEQQ
jgi:hypothetical protein